MSAARSFFVAAVEHADGYNGARATAFVVFDETEGSNGLLAVYPHGWHRCPPDLAWKAVRTQRAALEALS